MFRLLIGKYENLTSYVIVEGDISPLLEIAPSTKVEFESESKQKVLDYLLAYIATEEMEL